MSNNQFKNLESEYMEKLKLFVPIVNRVHGKEHPEFNDVKIEFDNISNKINNENYLLKEEFNNLKKITNNYQVPNNVCESYEMVYQMLKELDDAYRSENK